MNGRIIELARQATGRQVVGASDFADWDVIERFAESIVRECAKVANENVGSFTPGCGNAVLEHFGVE